MVITGHCHPDSSFGADESFELLLVVRLQLVKIPKELIYHQVVESISLGLEMIVSSIKVQDGFDSDAFS